MGKKIAATLILLAAVVIAYGRCFSYWTVNRVVNDSGKCLPMQHGSFKTTYNPDDWWDCGGIPTYGCWLCNSKSTTQTSTTKYYDDLSCNGNLVSTSSGSASINEFTKWTSC